MLESSACPVQGPLSEATVLRSRGQVLWSGNFYLNSASPVPHSAFLGIRPALFAPIWSFVTPRTLPQTLSVLPNHAPPNHLPGILPDFLRLPDRMWLLYPLHERPSVCIFSAARTRPSPAVGQAWTCPTHLPRPPFLSIISFLREELQEEAGFVLLMFQCPQCPA